MLPLKPTVGKHKRGEEEQVYLKHHGIFIVEKLVGSIGRQVIDISCFRRAAHIVPTDVWARRYWVNHYIDMETYNDLYDKNEWK
jgi:hypothetical protein